MSTAPLRDPVQAGMRSIQATRRSKHDPRARPVYNHNRCDNLEGRVDYGGTVGLR